MNEHADALIERLKGKLLHGAASVDVHPALAFECYRHHENGQVQRVDVVFEDTRKPGEGRYLCRVKSDDGAVADGEPAAEPEAALDLVSWADLDETASITFGETTSGNGDRYV